MRYSPKCPERGFSEVPVRGAQSQVKMALVGRSAFVDDEAQARHDDEAWERFIEAERRHLEDRRAGHLGRLLDGPLPGESAEELRLLAWEDQHRAEAELVELRSPGGEVSYKHIDDLTLEDRQARAEAERALMNRIMERQQRRESPSGGS
jgi:hypothetical protein